MRMFLVVSLRTVPLGRVTATVCGSSIFPYPSVFVCDEGGLMMMKVEQQMCDEMYCGVMRCIVVR